MHQDRDYTYTLKVFNCCESVASNYVIKFFECLRKMSDFKIVFIPFLRCSTDTCYELSSDAFLSNPQKRKPDKELDFLQFSDGNPENGWREKTN